MKRRRPASAEPPRTEPPRCLLYPTVEDWVAPDDVPADLHGSPLYRLADEDDVAWRFRQVAEQRFREALRLWLQEHRVRLPDGYDRHRWRLISVHPYPVCQWRDRASFVAAVVL